VLCTDARHLHIVAADIAQSAGASFAFKANCIGSAPITLHGCSSEGFLSGYFWPQGKTHTSQSSYRVVVTSEAMTFGIECGACA
jgi:hypothetical protein